MPDARERALALVEAGDLKGAIASFEAALRDAPGDPDALTDLGLALHEAGENAAAEKRLLEAIEIDDDHVPARRGLARVLDALGKLDAAVFQLLRAAKSAPADATIQRDLGTAFYKKGLFDKALAAYERAKAIGANDPRLHYAIALALEEKKDPGGAIASLREAIRLDPRFVEARHTLADALASFGEHELAISELEALLAVDRTNEKAAANLEILAEALARMRTERLVGRPLAALRASAIVQEGGFRDEGRAGEVQVLTTPYAEIQAGIGEGDAIEWLFLSLLDPTKAARQSGKRLGVEVVGEDGSPRAADLGTALGVTFLREGLGVTGTTAAKLWQRAATGGAGLTWGGIRVEAVTRKRGKREGEVHGLRLKGA